MSYRNIFNNCSILSSHISSANVLQQSVRWHRKPRWVPMAKSKLFRIPVRPVIPQEDVLELQRIHNNYRTKLRAIRNYLRSDMIAEKSSLANTSSEKSMVEEALEFEKCMQENDSWNKEIAEIRELRLEQDALARKEQLTNLIVKRNQYMTMKMESAQQVVEKMKEESKQFISRDSLDAAIEHSLSTVQDYNFAIDISGNIIPGRDADSKKAEAAEMSAQQ